MTVERRMYSDEDIQGALRAVDANKGYVKPTAEVLGIPTRTLQHWANEDVERAGRARRAMLGQKTDEGLAERYLDIAMAAQDRVMEDLPNAKAYQAMLISGISFDKRQMALGRPTSRTEALRARYIEPASLRSMARGVIDVETTQPQRRRGVLERPTSSHLPEKEKRRKKVSASAHVSVSGDSPRKRVKSARGSSDTTTRTISSEVESVTE